MRSVQNSYHIAEDFQAQFHERKVVYIDPDVTMSLYLLSKRLGAEYAMILKYLKTILLFEYFLVNDAV